MSSDPRLQRVKEIFIAAIEAPEAERSSVVLRAAADDSALAADVIALLDHHSRPSALLRELTAKAVDHHPENDGLPLSMGRYTLQRLLGEGATGRVFAGVQQNPRRPVAIKLLRPGLQSHRRTTERFLREAEVLAKLDHPGIARVFESGIAELPWGPQAFIAMELIDGVPLTQFATSRNLNVAQKLELLAKICDAVEYSHAHGVIHRDLKPSNVLVQPDGQPRVLDFGVAHAMHDEAGTLPTLNGDLVGTLAYMSPEYADGKDKGGLNCDVYSLGVIAYELISGYRPVVTEGVRLWEAIRAIREHRFPPLRERSPGCGIDLDMVVDKALRADPADRYQTAREFAADLRRIIANRPVSVRSSTIGYRLAKFLRRTRKASIVATAAITVLLVTGSFSVRQWMITRHKLREAELLMQFESFLPKHRPGVTAAESTEVALAAVSKRATLQLADYPAVEARIQYRLGLEYAGSLGRFAQADRAFQRSIELMASKGLDDVFVCDVLRDWAALNVWRDSNHTAENTVRRILDALSRRGNDPVRLYFVRQQLAWIMASGGRGEELEIQLDEMKKLAESSSGLYDFASALFDFRIMRAAAKFNAGKVREAAELLPSADSIKASLASTPWRLVVRSTAHLASSVQISLGNIEIAKDLLTQLLQATVSEVGTKSFEAVAVRSRLAGLLWLTGAFDAAERNFAEIAASTGPDGLDDPALRANALNSRGVCLRDLGHLPEAESTLNEALSIRLTTGGPDSSVVADTRTNLASLYIRLGRGRDALASAEEAARIQRVRGRMNPTREAESLALIGRAHSLIGGTEAGLPYLQRAWLIRWQSGILTDWQTTIATDSLFDALITLGRYQEAKVIAEQEHSKLVETAGPENSATKLAAKRLAKLAVAPTVSSK